ncbi:UNKNOWN [Stylonychia lemnae]|uniref:Uncharacterized protein n=1 Tax=Stylonychia lemnae TaxID=5949 RepID=A0A078AS68_STYLE|nr:UNKNOWN [Stylonychia lemnae]|eukprot:CDW83733.1 UNKNOWN [Stylonychia lemnae]
MIKRQFESTQIPDTVLQSRRAFSQEEQLKVPQSIINGGQQATEKGLLLKIEDNVKKDYEAIDEQNQNYLQVTEIKNVYLKKDPKRAQIEVLQGRYNLRMNQNLPFTCKIQQFSNEPMAYYLFKKRDFMQRLQQKELTKKEKEELEFEELTRKLMEDSSGIRNKKFHEYIKKIRKAIWLKKMANQKNSKLKDNIDEDAKAFKDLDGILEQSPVQEAQQKQRKPLGVIMQQIKQAKYANLQKALEIKKNQCIINYQQANLNKTQDQIQEPNQSSIVFNMGESFPKEEFKIKLNTQESQFRLRDKLGQASQETLKSQLNHTNKTSDVNPSNKKHIDVSTKDTSKVITSPTQSKTIFKFPKLNHQAISRNLERSMSPFNVKSKYNTFVTNKNSNLNRSLQNFHSISENSVSEDLNLDVSRKSVASNLIKINKNLSHEHIKDYDKDRQNARNIVINCEKSHQKIKKNFKTFQQSIKQTNDYTDSINLVSQTMKDIENSPGPQLGATFVYQKMIQKEQYQEEQQTCYDYRSAQIDPSKLLTKWERQLKHKK